MSAKKPQRKLLLSLDVGTGRVKAGLFTAEGQQLALASAPYEIPVNPARPGWAEVDPRVWKKAIVRALAELSKRAPLEDACALGLSTLFPALVVMDKDGEPLRPAILYSDLRSQQQIEEARRTGLAETVLQVSGNPLVAGTCTASSLLWLRQEAPELFRRAAIWGHASTYLAKWLVGEALMERISAPLTGLYDVNTQEWSPALAAAVGVGDRLPRLISPVAVAGKLTEAAAAETGLPTGLPLVLGGGDAVCGMIGAGLVDTPQEVFLAAGTTDSVCVQSDRPARDTRVVTAGHPSPDKWVIIGALNFTGGALEWLGRHILRQEIPALLEQAQASLPGAGGSIFLPYLRGERTPIWDAAARGVWWGISDSTTRADLVRALLEGVGYGLRACLEAVEEVCGYSPARPGVDTIIAAGGATASRLWNQIRADITGKRMLVLAETECSLRGAAWMAARAMGLVEGSWPIPLEWFGSAHHKVAEEFTPKEEYQQVYADGYQIFRALYQDLKEANLFSRARECAGGA